ncbi:MAG: DUF1028 domain-containing protein [Methylobacteriaceae bacterium]|nr:DUF1028 domain-containing protein [Methylobacteriaceae bacterium]
MTFSIVARCPETQMFGVAVSSSSPAVAARCAFARSGVGAVATQNITDPSLGSSALDFLELGATAEEAVQILRRARKNIEFRQLLVVDAAGRTGSYSGPRALGKYGDAKDNNAACGGNLLADVRIPEIMAKAFAASHGHLADRMLDAMRAAVRAGGEMGQLRSAGLKIVGKVSWPIVDLRVDWTDECPIAALSKVWDVYKPQLEDYVTRALDPSAAPSYGVPGDP